jgi:hypothetical protein
VRTVRGGPEHRVHKGADNGRNQVENAREGGAWVPVEPSHSWPIHGRVAPHLSGTCRRAGAPTSGVQDDGLTTDLSTMRRKGGQGDMRIVRAMVGLTASVCALGIGAAAASASSFESSGGAGKGVGVSLNEEFRLYPMTVVCTKAAAKSSVPGGSFETYTDEIKYSSCTTFGAGVKVTISPVQVEYNANGTESILNSVIVTQSVLKCHYEIPPQSAFAKESVLFEDGIFYGNPKFPDGQKKLTIYTKLQGVHYTAVGWPCIGPKTPPELKEGKEVEEEGEAGKIFAAVHDEVTNGQLTWVK